MRDNQWETIWNSEYPATEEQKKALEGARKYSLSHLMKLGAFFSISSEEHENSLLKVLRTARKTGNDLDILEIGCGSGASLKALKPFAKTISGIDYSSKQISVCKEVFPEGEFKVCAAIDVDFAGKQYDFILSNSVFQYFPNAAYAREVMKKMLGLLKPGGAGVVLDIPDSDYEQVTLDYTLKQLGEDLVEQMPEQNYYRKDVFREFAKANKINFRIEQQEVTTYPNSSFRFNFIFWKNELEFNQDKVELIA